MAGAESPNRSPEIRKDGINNRWVIFSPARSRRPSDFKSKSNPNPNNQSECPFCKGHEHECAPEIFRIPADSTSDWRIRVIQNLYPALNRDLHFQNRNHEDSFSRGDVSVSGFGFHDVVIESPVHSVHLIDLSPAEVGDVLLAFKARIDQLRMNDSIKYVQVFKNHGASAGASMSHSHSQMIALPIVPPTVSARLNSMKEYYEQTGNCSLCDIRVDDLIINESTHFKSVVPFAATFPFEIWIIPRDHSTYFHDLDSEKAVDLGGLLKFMLLKMSSQLNNPPFNFMIHTSPFQVDPSYLPCCHWFLQIVPQLSGVGGFELGTGCYINPVFPEDAAKILREVKVPDQK
nr:ADP-glucose phosphorylase [Ipomoea batatas]